MKNLILLSIFVFLTVTGKAQSDTTQPTTKQPPKRVEVILKDGNIFRGELINQNKDSVVVHSNIVGKVSIPQHAILEVKYLDDTKPGNQGVYTNLSGRYFVSPSAINMKKGDGYYQNIWFFFNSFNYAFTNHFTMGGGFEMFSLLAGQPVFYITPKVNAKVAPNLHVGIGYLHFNYALMAEESATKNSLNMIYGSVTLGKEDANLSVNYGQELVSDGGQLITISGFFRVVPKFGVITENWIFSSSDNYAIYSFGGRVIGRKNLFDFGLMVNGDIAEAGIIGIPFLSYSLRF